MTTDLPGGQPHPNLLHEQIYAALAERGEIAPTGQVPYWSDRTNCIAWKPANEYALSLAGTVLDQPEPVGGQPQPDTTADRPAWRTRALAALVTRAITTRMEHDDATYDAVYPGNLAQSVLDVFENAGYAVVPQPDTTNPTEVEKLQAEVKGLRAFADRVRVDRDWHAGEADRVRQEHQRMETRLALLSDRLDELVMNAGGPVPADADDALSIISKLLAAVRGEPHTDQAPCVDGCRQETCASTAAYSGQCGSCCDCYGTCELAAKSKRAVSAADVAKGGGRRG